MRRLRIVPVGPAILTVALGLGTRDASAQGWEPLPQPQEPAVEPAPGAGGEAAAPAGAAAGEGVHVELGGEIAYLTPPIRGGTNPFGAGFGGRVGLVWSGLYLGVSVTSFLGGKDVDVSYRALFYGLDLGYGIHLADVGRATFSLRPGVGVGIAAVYYTDPSLAADVVTTASGSSSGSTTLTVNNGFVRPGLTLLFSGGGVFAALDGSAVVLPGIAYGGADATTWVSYGLQGEAGFRF